MSQTTQSFGLINCAALAGLVLGIVDSAQAHADTYGRRSAHARSPSYSEPYAPNDDVCRPWCDLDRSPCDPPYFKVADGRCSNPMPRR